MGRAFVLAFAVHAVLLAVMVFGVRWQNYPAEAVTVELWEPPPPAPALEVPKPPPPKVEPPKPPPEPEVKKPEIVEKAAPKPKPKPEAKPAPKDDEIQRTLLREQLALEQRKIDEQRRKIEEERRRTEEARRRAEAERLAAVARNKALTEYVNRIRARVRQNWILPADLQGNPECVFRVIQLPTGEVIEARLVKSSGNAAYDDAVHRAILKASPLPLPAQREHFYRELELTFRPRD
jgi:colicin import membrane protein